MATPFSSQQKAFSDKAHFAARSILYPAIFNVEAENLAYEDQGDLATDARYKALDGEMAIDRLVKVTLDKFRSPLTFTVQERFRKPEYAKYRDLTITEWNTWTSRESELYKLHAALFLYGYYNPFTECFIEAICADVPALMMAITTNGIRYTHETKKNGSQTFLGLKFDDMHRAGVMLFHYRHLPNTQAQMWHRNLVPQKTVVQAARTVNTAGNRAVSQ